MRRCLSGVELGLWETYTSTRRGGVAEPLCRVFYLRGIIMLKLYNDGSRISAVFSGDIDHHAAREYRVLLDDVIARSRPELLVFDMDEVGFMDSSGIGLILGRLKSVKSVGGELLIKNARSEIAEVIKISGLSALLVESSNKKSFGDMLGAMGK